MRDKYHEIKALLHRLFEKARDYDEANPRKLKKYVYAHFIILGLQIAIKPIISLIFMYSAVIIILVLALITGIPKGMLSVNNDESNVTELDSNSEIDDQMDQGSELTTNSDFESPSHYIKMILGAFLLFNAIFFLGGQLIIKNLTITFPVLFDIKWETDWLMVNPLYLLRTFFNLLQFMIMFYLMRKVRKKMKTKILRKLGRDYDFYDKSFYGMNQNGYKQ